MAIREQTFDTFDDFRDEVKRRGLTLVKLTDYAFTEPAQVGGAWVIQPKVKLIATAVDRHHSTLLRWEVARPARQMVTITAGTGRGTHTGSEFVDKKEQVKQVLELDGILASDGEWTADGVEAL